jgi:hypothetical protein
LDTNVLLLYLASLVGMEFAQGWKRSQVRAPEAKFLLHDSVEAHVIALTAAVVEAKRCEIRLLTTPHVLTEASNFVTGEETKDRDREQLKLLLERFAIEQKEIFVPSKDAVKGSAFKRLGLADVALIALCKRRHQPLVLTMDGPLTWELEARKHPVANLTHYAFEDA